MSKSPKTATKPAPRRGVLKLPADLGVEHARDFQEKLAGRVEDARTIVLDAREVSRIHTAAIQLLCIFCQDRRNAGRQTQWRQPSDTLRSAASLLGVSTLLELAREGA
ncbi:MAG: STAS domain-containing protein [Nevskiales bacterium]|nr:STAS domain-containing protein [Nevskiales bacterium]